MRLIQLSEVEAGKLRSVIKIWNAGLADADIHPTHHSVRDREIRILSGIEKKLRRARRPKP